MYEYMYIRKLLDGSKCFQMAPNVSRCLRMIPECSGRLQMSPDSSKCFCVSLSVFM